MSRQNFNVDSLLPFSCRSPRSRTTWPVLAGVCVIVLVAHEAFVSKAAAQGSQAVHGKQEILTTKDGHRLSITYYESPLKEQAPVVILLHRKGGNQLFWTAENGFAEQLNQEGYAVVAVDLRKHGQSKAGAGGSGTDSVDLRPDDYKAMVGFDLEAVKAFIRNEHHEKKLNMGNIAIIAPEMSAPIAVAFAHHDWSKRPYDDAPTFAARTRRGQDVRALVLISPEGNLPGIQIGRILNSLRTPDLGIAFLIAVGTEDSLDGGQAKKIYQQVSAPAQNKDRMYLREYDGYKLRGTDLLGKNVGLEVNMLAFLSKHVKDLKIPWEDRRPRFRR